MAGERREEGGGGAGLIEASIALSDPEGPYHVNGEGRGPRIAASGRATTTTIEMALKPVELESLELVINLKDLLAAILSR